MSISVVIPAYNVEKWISGAVRSVLDQRPAPHEVIVVDDGSTDSTAAVVSDLGAGVKLISQRNAGPAAARNTGVRAATGDVVYLLDADDEALPEAFARVLEAFRAEPKAGAVTGNFVQCDPHGRRQLAWTNHPAKRVLRRPDAGSMLLRNHLSANSAFRTEVLKEYVFREDFDLRGCEDLDLWLRLLLDEVPVVTLGSPLCLYRVTRVGALTAQASTMRRHRNFMFRGFLRDRRLRPRERVITLYQCIRTAIGIATARSSAPRSSVDAPGREHLTVLQVAMKEPGGGRVHIEELQAGLKDQVDSHVLELTTHSFARPREWLECRRELRKAIGKLAPDVVHAHGVRAAASALMAGGGDAKRIVTIHGLHSLRRSNGVRAIVNATLNRVVLSRMSRILVLSASDRERLHDAHVSDDRIQTIRAAVRVPTRMKKETARTQLQLAQDSFVVLWLGRFDDEKDPLTFVAAMRGLKNEGMNGIMAGEGPLMPEVAKAIDESELNKSVSITGWLPDPSAVFAAADVFVTTSLWEGFPLAALEAAASGLPLVATDVAGNRDVVASEVQARLVPPRDPDRLAAELRKAHVRSRGSGYSQSGHGSLIAEEFSRENLAADVLHAYETVVERDFGEKAATKPQDSEKRPA